MQLLKPINVGHAPNDQTGDTLRARDTFGLKVLPTLEILNELTDILRQRYSCQKRSAVLERTR